MTPAGFDRGPSRLKIVRDAEVGAHRREMAHRRMVRLRRHEADPGLGEAALDLRATEADGDAEGGEHVAGAGARGGGAVAVLGDRHAAGGDDHRRERRDIVGAVAVAAGADDVDGTVGCGHPQHLPAHRRDGTGQLVHRLAAHAQPHQEGAHLRGGRLAGEQQVERGLGLGAGERAAGGDRGEDGLQRLAHPTAAGSRRAGALARQAAARSRKFRMIVRPPSEAMLSGWNCTPWIGKVRCESPMISPSVSPVTCRQAGRVARSTTSEW